jgi:hypothetical protein
MITEMMITFKQFLSEEGSGRLKEINPETALTLIMQNCMGYIEAVKAGSRQIWRGTYNNAPILIGDSNLGSPRKSANTYNYYTLFMDNSPQWSEFPKRSRSFICSTSSSTSNGFGDLFIVLPYDDAHVGVTPRYDLWQAFVDGDVSTSSLDKEMTILNSLMVNEFRLTHKDDMRKNFKKPNTYEELVRILESLTLDRIKEVAEFGEIMKISAILDNAKRALMKLDETNSNNYLDYFKKLFATDNFKHGKASSINIDARDVELYIQGKAIFIKVMVSNKQEEDRKDIIDFLKSYKFHLND